MILFVDVVSLMENSLRKMYIYSVLLLDSNQTKKSQFSFVFIQSILH